MQRAITDGEVSPDADIPAALDALYSPLYSHLFLGLKVHSDDEIDRHCDLLFPSIFRMAKINVARRKNSPDSPTT